MIVPDTSVIIKLFFPEERSDLARALYRAALEDAEQIIAPQLLPCEVVNAIRRKMRRDGLGLAPAERVLDEFLGLPIDVQNDPEIYRLALQLTERYSLSGFDAQFVALGQLAGCDVWFDDERVLTAIGGRLPYVRRLSDYAKGG